MVCDHLLGELLDVCALALFLRQVAGDHFGDTGFSGRIDEIVRRRCLYLQRSQAHQQGNAGDFQQWCVHVSLLRSVGATSMSHSVEPQVWVKV
ncbi:hypothetical protein D3C81_735140 [compost metagenome]